MTSRSGAIDAVRLLGCVAIVAGHVWTRDATAEILYTWHVPLFFFLAGWFWTPQRSMRTELSKRWRTLGKPYVAWVLLLSLTTCLLIVANRAEPDRLLGGLWGGSAALQPFTTIWFVSVLFFTAVLYRAISPLPAGWQWGLGIAGALLGALFGPQLAATPLSAGSAIGCLIYLLAGTALNRPGMNRRWLAATVVLAVSAVLIATGISRSMDVKFGDYGTPLLSSAVAVGISYALVVFSTIVFDRLEAAAPTASALARTALVIVLLHPLLLYVPGPDALRLAIGVLVPVIVGLLCLASPASEWLTGQPRRPRVRATASDRGECRAPGDPSSTRASRDT
ncbi:acyltransferase [Microbacterium esteraromaticum]|uniref:Acyltransferase n=1 Tax=Microbacterium esteraromaticum TaxID=57043 RepID=A0A7D8AKT5_9MICO|nr:acyltransferase [Microbacterium esteraromaticum]QMU97969.1 acyltransferase [Microbacterium esteraromaticum]